MEFQMFVFDSINSFADLQTKWEKVHLPKRIIVQILEAEKIRLTTLLRRFAKMRFQSIQDTFEESDTEMKQEVLLKAYILADLIQVKEPKDETEGETNIIYYIVGYMAKALTKAKCISCTSKLVASDESHGMELDHMEMGDGDKSVFLSLRQKGGLCKPTEFMHLICLFIWNHFNSIQHDGEARKLLFESSLPRNVFVETSTLLLMETMDMPEKLP